MCDRRTKRMVRFELRLYPGERLRLGEVARTLGCSLSEFARLSMNTCASEMQEGANLFDRNLVCAYGDGTGPGGENGEQGEGSRETAAHRARLYSNG